MNRRHLLAMLGLGLAPLAFNPHRVYFDMGRKLWVPDPYFATMAEFFAYAHRFDATLINMNPDYSTWWLDGHKAYVKRHA